MSDNGCLSEFLQSQVMTPDTGPEADVIIIDDSALVNSSKTFDDYDRVILCLDFVVKEISLHGKHKICLMR